MANSTIHRCPYCGAIVIQTPGRKEKKFCSDKCRSRWWYDHRDQINRRSMRRIACVNCGKVFETYNASRKYCCLECYNEHRWRSGNGTDKED